MLLSSAGKHNPHSQAIIHSKTHDATPDSSDYHNHHRPCIMLQISRCRKQEQKWVPTSKVPVLSTSLLRILLPPSLRPKTLGGARRLGAEQPGGGRTSASWGAHNRPSGGALPIQPAGAKRSNRPPQRGRADRLASHVIKSYNTG